MGERRGSAGKFHDIFEDDFNSYLEDAQRDPEFRAAFEDSKDRQTFLDSLIKLRRFLKLTQAEVARRMGVSQPTVAGFEKESSDPKLSTVQRYARAVEGRARLVLEMPAECDWVSSSSYKPSVPVMPRTATPAHVRHGSTGRRWLDATRRAKEVSDWVLAG